SARVSQRCNETRPTRDNRRQPTRTRPAGQTLAGRLDAAPAFRMTEPRRQFHAQERMVVGGHAVEAAPAPTMVAVCAVERPTERLALESFRCGTAKTTASSRHTHVRSRQGAERL